MSGRIRLRSGRLAESSKAGEQSKHELLEAARRRDWGGVTKETVAQLSEPEKEQLFNIATNQKDARALDDLVTSGCCPTTAAVGALEWAVGVDNISLVCNITDTVDLPPYSKLQSLGLTHLENKSARHNAIDKLKTSAAKEVVRKDGPEQLWRIRSLQTRVQVLVLDNMYKWVIHPCTTNVDYFKPNMWESILETAIQYDRRLENEALPSLLQRAMLETSKEGKRKLLQATDKLQLDIIIRFILSHSKEFLGQNGTHTQKFLFHAARLDDANSFKWLLKSHDIDLTKKIKFSEVTTVAASLDEEDTEPASSDDRPPQKRKRSLLHWLLASNAFDLTWLGDRLRQVLEWSAHERDGYTLLHAAIDCWRENSSGKVVDNILQLLQHGADIDIEYPERTRLKVLQLLSAGSQEASSVPACRRHELIMAAVKSARTRGRDIDWTPEQNTEWNVLHAVCAEGQFQDLRQLVDLGADPLQLRHGLSLIDTVVLDITLASARKEQVIRELVQPEIAPGFIAAHRSAVETRMKRGEVDTPLAELMKSVSLPESLNTLKMLLEVQALTPAEKKVLVHADDSYNTETQSFLRDCRSYFRSQSQQ